MVSAIAFDYNVYVMLTDGTIAVLSNTKRGHFGTDAETGLTSEFGDVAIDSFVRARTNCHDKTPGLTLPHRWRVFSVAVGGGKDEPRPAFEVLGFQDPAKMKELRDAAQWLQKYIQQKWADKIGYAWNNTSPAQRETLITAYVDIRGLLDSVGGHEVASQITLGKKVAPALLSEPEADLNASQAILRYEEAKSIEELAKEHEDEKALPKEVIDVPVMNYGSEVKVEDLPF